MLSVMKSPRSQRNARRRSAYLQRRLWLTSGAGTEVIAAQGRDWLYPAHRRVSTVVVQRFCKPKVGGSNPSPGTILQAASLIDQPVELTLQDRRLPRRL